MAPALALASAIVAGCASGEGPVTDCVVADAEGAAWQGSGVTPLSAQETALIACGKESRVPSTCAVQSCSDRW